MLAYPLGHGGAPTLQAMNVRAIGCSTFKVRLTGKHGIARVPSQSSCQ